MFQSLKCISFLRSFASFKIPCSIFPRLINSFYFANSRISHLLFFLWHWVYTFFSLSLVGHQFLSSPPAPNISHKSPLLSVSKVCPAFETLSLPITRCYSIMALFCKRSILFPVIKVISSVCHVLFSLRGTPDPYQCASSLLPILTSCPIGFLTILHTHYACDVVFSENPLLLP